MHFLLFEVMKEQYDHRLRSLRQEHEKIKIQYETRATTKVFSSIEINNVKLI